MKDLVKVETVSTLEEVKELMNYTDEEFSLSYEKLDKYIGIVNDKWIDKIIDNLKEKAEEIKNKIKKLESIKEHIEGSLHRFLLEVGSEYIEFEDENGIKKYLYLDEKVRRNVMEDKVDKTKVGTYLVKLTAEEFMAIKNYLKDIDSEGKVKYICNVTEALEKCPEAVYEVKVPSVKVLKNKRKE